jgi:hypothetical protein
MMMAAGGGGVVREKAVQKTTICAGRRRSTIRRRSTGQGAMVMTRSDGAQHGTRMMVTSMVSRGSFRAGG